LTLVMDNIGSIDAAVQILNEFIAKLQPSQEAVK